MVVVERDSGVMPDQLAVMMIRRRIGRGISGGVQEEGEERKAYRVR